MTDAFVEFEVAPTSGRLAIPEWMWGAPVRFRIAFDTLVRLFGEPGDFTPPQIMQLNRPAIDAMARRRIAQLAARPAEPVELEYEDFLS